ncbi:MAG: acyl carrier protein [Kiritimatiellales bacterium]|jgi:acyl carrier protein
MNVTIALFVICVAALLVWGCQFWNRCLIRKHLAGRPSLTSHEFGQRYYPENSDLAATIRDILQQFIRTDISRITPPDQPVRDLYLDAFDGLAPNDLIAVIEDRFGIQIEDSAAEKMRTVDDIIKQVIAKVQEKVSAS